MGMTIRVSTPGNNCLTDTNLDHYSLYADQDNILIKTAQSGSVTLNYGSIGTVSHSLGYIPAALGWGDDGNGNLILARTRNAFQLSDWLFFTTNSNIQIVEGGSFPGPGTLQYFIFYDKIV